VSDPKIRAKLKISLPNIICLYLSATGSLIGQSVTLFSIAAVDVAVVVVVVFLSTLRRSNFEVYEKSILSGLLYY
jgi:hypothetical protein